jgi:hypothetical protein
MKWLQLFFIIHFLYPNQLRSEIRLKVSADLKALFNSDFKSVSFSNYGTCILLKPFNDFPEPNNYAKQKGFAIKFEPFALFPCGTFALSAEKSIKPGRSMEVGLGFMGIYKSEDVGLASSGYHIRLGYKYFKSPNFSSRGSRYYHVLNGTYFKPEITYSRPGLKNTQYYSSYQGAGYVYTTSYEVDNALGIAGIINVGKQWVFNDLFLLDIFAGIGLGYGTIISTNVVSTRTQYSNDPIYSDGDYGPEGIGGIGLYLNYYGNKIGFAGQFGFRVGMLIGKRKTELKEQLP